MRAAVVDVGSNSVRLLVAAAGRDGPVAVREERAYVGLGEEIERRGAIAAAKLTEAADTARRYARIARKLRSERIEVVVTAPGRQATNADELVDALARATRAPVHVLSPDDEGALAYAGAIARARLTARSVAVCDLGGGSIELVVGTPPPPPVWSRSLDLGSLRLTTGFLPSDPPTEDEIAVARREVEDRFDGMAPPRVEAALVVGGSARGLARLVGPTLDRDSLREALELAVERRSAKVARAYGLDAQRARVLPAGALVLSEVTRRLGVALELARGGLREGVVAALLAEAADAQAKVAG